MYKSSITGKKKEGSVGVCNREGGGGRKGGWTITHPMEGGRKESEAKRKSGR